MRSSERKTRKKLTAALIGLTLVAVACGSDADTSGTTLDTGTPVETQAAAAPDGTESPITEAPAESGVPQRVVSLSPTHTEIMFAIGAGDVLVAVDEFSNHPADALDLPNGLSGFEPNLEAIAAFEPDLVLLSGDSIVAQLDELGIASWVGPAAATLDDTYDQIEQLGVVTGRVGDAAELVSEMQTRVADIVAAAPVTAAPISFFHELDPTFFSVSSDTFIGAVYSMLGLANIADIDNDGNPFPQLNAEFIVDANPDLIFLADTKCCAENAQTVADRPGFDAIAAVQNGNVIEMDDDIASRWGPRIVDYFEVVAAAIDRAAVPA